MLHDAVQDVVLKLDAVRSRLIDTPREAARRLARDDDAWRSAPIGWRRASANSSSSIPKSSCSCLLSDDELDLGMREADVALRLREPMQPDLIRRRLFTVHFHAYASADYLKKQRPAALDRRSRPHRLVAFGAPTATHFLYDLNSLLTVGRDAKIPRAPHIAVNNLGAIIRAVEHGVGIAVLPDYCVHAELRPGAAAAAGGHAGNGLLSRLRRGNEERRARAGVPRFPRLQGAALALLSGAASARALTCRAALSPGPCRDRRPVRRSR